MKRIAILLIAFVAGFTIEVSAQITVTFTDGGSVTIPCAVEHEFLDGYGGAYGNNIDQTLTVCVSGGEGNAVAFTFAENFGGYFDIDPSDTLFVYDGPDINSPLIAALNNGTSPFAAATGIGTVNNSSGCLTFHFVTDGADVGEGFQGVISCNYICQPIEPFITSDPAIMPVDTGTIDICLGDTVWLNANANFPLSPASGGSGYNQTIANSEIEWQVAGGYEVTGASGYFVPQENAGYYVDVIITDTLGCFEYSRTKVRVSTVPSYVEMASVLDDTICYGESAVILGGLNTVLADTVGVNPTTGEFLLGGLFAEQLELPDGSGTIDDIYSTTISISGASPIDTISEGSQLVNVCIEMEHSFLGDLEMWLTCPNGQDSIVIFNAYDGNSNAPGFVPGGFSPGTIDLGIPGQGTGTGQGTCFEYCFSITENNLGTFATEFGNMGTQMDAGTYLPEQSFDNLVGCPINGDWTLNVADNWTIDDGWICQWSIQLVDSLSPNPEFYTPNIVNGWWDSDPSIVANLGDTAIEVLPPTSGDHPYTFNVEDNFGCNHDTTVVVNVVPQLTSFTPTDTLCGLEFELSAADYDIVGEWSFSAPQGTSVSFFPDMLNYNPTVTVSEPGSYEFIYSSDYCGQVDSSSVTILPIPQPVTLADQTVCPGSSLTFDGENEDIGATYEWLPFNESGQTFVLDSVTQTTGIQVNITNDCGTANGAATITVESLDVSGPSDVCLDDVAQLDADFTTSGGVWTFSGPEGATVGFFPLPNNPNGTTLPSPEIEASQEGAYTFWFTDNDCGMMDSVDVFFTPAPTIEVVLDTNRVCVEDMAILSFTSNTELYDSFSWEPFGLSSDTIMILGTDSLAFNPIDTSFYVTAMIENFCGTDSEEITYKVIDCNLDVPNVFNPESSVPENQYFNIVALDLHPGNNVKIFDRWGRKCYDVDDYHLNPWNGGKEADGVYYYTLVRPGYEAETGYVHLVRGSQ